MKAETANSKTTENGGWMLSVKTADKPNSNFKKREPTAYHEGRYV